MTTTVPNTPASPEGLPALELPIDDHPAWCSSCPDANGYPEDAWHYSDDTRIFVESDGGDDDDPAEARLRLALFERPEGQAHRVLTIEPGERRGGFVLTRPQALNLHAALGELLEQWSR